MRYPFLEHNRLVLVDYLPGSSGQLLLRLWSELDSRLMYDNATILSELSITPHLGSREIDYDILIPKRITNWFLDRCQPQAVDDYLQFFEFLGTTIVALQQKWVKGQFGQKFYDDDDYKLEGRRVLYGIHTWGKLVPWAEMRARGYEITVIKIVPNSTLGLKYQHDRCQACYPFAEGVWPDAIERFNSKTDAAVAFDFCTLLATKDTAGIIGWIAECLGPDLRQDKLSRVSEILETYYSNIVDMIL